MDMGKWLRDAGFERYEPLFAEHAIDADVLGELTELDLEKLSSHGLSVCVRRVRGRRDLGDALHGDARLQPGLRRRP